jgi:hypothetical protein
MKTMILAILLAQALMTTSAFADDTFPYTFLNPGRIGPCPDVTPLVFNVESVAATFSGGSNGSDNIWTPIDGRAENEMQAGLQSYPLASLTYPASIAGAIDKSILLTESLALHGAVVSICMSQIDLDDIVQNHTIGSSVTFDISFEVSVTMNTTAGQRETFLVQELRGSAEVKFDYYHVYYDGSCRPQPFIDKGWPALKAQDFSAFLKPVNNDEANKNLQSVKAELSQYLGSGSN